MMFPRYTRRILGSCQMLLFTQFQRRKFVCHWFDFMLFKVSWPPRPPTNNQKNFFEKFFVENIHFWGFSGSLITNMTLFFRSEAYLSKYNMVPRTKNRFFAFYTLFLGKSCHNLTNIPQIKKLLSYS